MTFNLSANTSPFFLNTNQENFIQKKKRKKEKKIEKRTEKWGKYKERKKNKNNFQFCFSICESREIMFSPSTNSPFIRIMNNNFHEFNL